MLEMSSDVAMGPVQGGNRSLCRILFIVAQEYQVLRTVHVNLCHNRDLRTALSGIILIDTHGINPDYALVIG